MHMRNRLLLPVLLLSMSLAAQDKPPDAGLVDRTITRLAAADSKVADQAMIALIRGDRGSVPLLQAVLARQPAGAVAERARRALQICAIDAPIVNGLKLGLAADQVRLAPGDAVTLTSTLCNPTDAPIAVFLGMSYSGNVLENAEGLARPVPPEAEGAVDGWIRARFGAVGFCGTGAKPIVVVVEPWSARQFRMPLEYRARSKVDDPCQHDGPHLAAPYVLLPLDPTQRRVRLQIRHQVMADASAAGEVEPRAKVEPAAKTNWTGDLTSNLVELELLDERKR
jgi:hypothetical protein